MEGVQEKLDALVRQGAAQAGVEVYHWQLQRLGRRSQLKVQVDRPGGVTVDDCARASRAIEILLDEADPLPGSYLLEVSSPGLERPLWRPEHYARAVGKLVEMKLRPDGILRGRLARVEADAVAVTHAGTELEVPFARVVQAHLIYEQEQDNR
ncbi:MAG: Bacterial ribosome SSU maturation protein RimP [Candidatus Bipolaricaulis sibiricus]|uniref:Ribosome maturation factor RimP n=1 Tax=Bipolaricaulis sibiricus TaxID=2501609 RepID=A0A410FTJ0_BIPS1|nr:MAG: Bacterial ribosome SSU maturation protein RimP [Candidatus Bipolaricaulis sibiricus]